jgi:hypothetical protein
MNNYEKQKNLVLMSFRPCNCVAHRPLWRVARVPRPQLGLGPCIRPKWSCDARSPESPSLVGMKTDRKIPLSFPYPQFIIGNGIGSGIVGNGNGSGINGIAKTNGNGNTNGNS